MTLLRKKIKFGISVKVLMGLFIIVIVAFISSGITKLYFNKFEKFFQTIPDNHLPLLITVSKMVKGTERLISHAPDIILTDNIFLLESISKEIELRFQQEKMLIDNLNKAKIKGLDDLSEKFQLLFNNLRTIIDLAYHDIEIKQRMLQISIHVRKISESLIIENTNLTKYDLAGPIRDQFIQIFSLLRDVSTLEDLQRFKEYNIQILEIEKIIDQFFENKNSQTRFFNLYYKTLKHYGTGNKGLLALSQNHLKYKLEIKENLIINKLLSDELVKQTDQIFTLVSEDIHHKSFQLTREIQLFGKVFLIIPFFIVISAFFIFIFIQKSVTARILGLEKCMKEHIKGNPIPVPSQGKDEIADMAKSVSYFIKMRKKYESSLQEAKLAAEKANLAKSAFLANMSHELRTPLNAILGYAQIFMEQQYLNPKIKDSFNIIYKSGNHLLMLINDILDISKIEAGKTELFIQEMFLPGLLNDIVNIISMRADEKKIEFIYKPSSGLPSMILADEKRLRQVLLNLLGNAVKFTDTGKVIFRIKAKLCTPKLCSIYFEVQDTGIGIMPKHMEKIFMPFEQVGDSRLKSEGTGLGLAISSNLIQLMGSKIHGQSEIGKGSVFSFEAKFPVTYSEIKHVEYIDKKITGYEGKKQKILIIDDKKENRLVLSDALMSLNFDIIMASNGAEGIKQAIDFKPNLIFMDIVMPKMDGFETVKNIRSIEEIKNLPVIAVSASYLNFGLQKIKEKDFNDFLPKPVVIKTLLNLVEKYLPITWIYEKTNQESDQKDKYDKSKIIPPSMEELEALYEMAMLGLMTKIQERALNLEKTNSKYSLFAEHLKNFSQNYDEENLMIFLEKYLYGINNNE